MDEESLDYFDYLTEEMWGNYNELRDNMIEHYDTGIPMSTQWSDLNQHKQCDNEAVTQHHEDIPKLVRPMQLAPEQMLYIFINPLDENTKIHWAMNDPPENLAKALARAKTYQSQKQ